VSEDLKATFGKGWVDFSDLLQPGALEVKKRVFLQTCPPLVKKMGENNVETYQEVEGDFEQTFEPAKSYIYLKLTLSDPVAPTE